MACAHNAGLPVLVVSVTDGEACYPGHPVWLPQRLREERQRELDRALGCLGLANAERRAWHIGDGTVSQHEAEVTARLLALLREDDLVLAPWMLDAHPDHEAVGRACARAASHRDCARREFPVWGWHWLAPEQAAVLWSPARRFRLSPQVRQRKCAAIDQFATQTGAAPGLECDPILPDTVLQRFQRDYEVLLG
jgi:LmbE family N-acetylglucosaminyl deacetylase